MLLPNARQRAAAFLMIFFTVTGDTEPPILQAIGHRTGSTGLILGLVGFGISIWATVELGFLRGTAGPNSYGPDPLQVR